MLWLTGCTRTGACVVQGGQDRGPGCRAGELVFECGELRDLRLRHGPRRGQGPCRRTARRMSSSSRWNASATLFCTSVKRDALTSIERWMPPPRPARRRGAQVAESRRTGSSAGPRAGNPGAPRLVVLLVAAGNQSSASSMTGRRSCARLSGSVASGSTRPKRVHAHVVVGRLSTWMKSLGKRSSPSISSVEAGSMKMLANGVAVKPT